MSLTLTAIVCLCGRSVISFEHESVAHNHKPDFTPLKSDIWHSDKESLIFGSALLINAKWNNNNNNNNIRGGKHFSMEIVYTAGSIKLSRSRGKLKLIDVEIDTNSTDNDFGYKVIMKFVTAP